MNTLTLSEVQSLMDSYETRREARHSELSSNMNKRFDQLEARLRTVELTQAGNQPVVKGVSKVSLMLVAALISGYIGSLISGS